MNKFFASLLCCSLTLPLLLQAESTNSQSPSQKKFTRKQLSQAANAPAKKPEEKKKATEKTSTSPAKKTASAPSKHSVISNSSGATVKKIPQKSKITRGSPVILAAADQEEQTTASSAEEAPSKHCEPGPSSFRFSMAHREGKGIGYPQGYTSLDMFFAFSATEKAHPFFDIRGHMSNDGKPAANIGFGIRYLPDMTNAVFGINAFFDFRQARHSTFEQLGLGLEILGTQWSLHLNGYMPIIRTDNIVEVSFYKFSGNSALIHLENEVALTGADASLGRSLVHRGFFDLDAYLGGYFFQGKKQLTAPGGYVKLTSSLSRFFSVELQGSYDTLYKMIFQGAAAINIPLGKRVKIGNPERSCYTETALCRNITDPVSRFEMIVTHLHQDTEIGLDPRTGLPLSIVFVNNTSTGGNGTAEAPYSTLVAAETNSSKGEMIYVYTGNGTSSGMDVGITLQDRQWLQGSATSFDLLSTSGPVLVPALTSQLPNISNNISGVTLASGNIVNGFKITAPVCNIFAPGSVIGAQITNNVLSDALTADIQFANAAGLINIESNKCNSFIGMGIDIASTTTFSANIESNTFTNSGAANINMLLTNNSMSNIVIENNTLQNSQYGLEFILENNAISSVRIEGNTFSTNELGLFGTLNIFPRDQSTMTANIFTNTFSGPNSGIVTIASGTSNLTLGVLDNSIFSTALEGAVFANDILSAATTTLALVGNTSTSTAGFVFENLGIFDTFNVMSPNLQISGVEKINTGTIGIAGTITYIPFNPPTVE
ncbi:MAG: inverse autotransporter beta domain-containing protein [Chlamydiae bacterium]|nr:inverse autotransporter beta domain-containing protein [Chlamydiota bacterium]